MSQLRYLSPQGSMTVNEAFIFLQDNLHFNTRVAPDPKKPDATPKQRITLSWSEEDSNGVGILHDQCISFLFTTLCIFSMLSTQVELGRNITIEFSRNDTIQKYGVRLKPKIAMESQRPFLGEQNQCSVRGETVHSCQKLYRPRNQWGKKMSQQSNNGQAQFLPHSFQTTSTNVTVTSYVSMTTFMMDPWEFLVPVNRYFIQELPELYNLLKICALHCPQTSKQPCNIKQIYPLQSWYAQV